MAAFAPSSPATKRQVWAETMTYRMSRRCFQGAGMALLAGAACGAGPLAQERPTKLLRFMWWGGQDRLRRTLAAFAAFERRYPAVRATGEASANGGPFWAKLATQVAGGNAPDVYQMDYRVEAEYGIRGAALPLDPYMPDLLDMRDFPAYARDAGKVDGKTYGIGRRRYPPDHGLNNPEQGGP